MGIFVKIILSELFIYVSYILRKVVRSFFKKRLLTSIQISGLKLIGQLTIFTSIAEVILDFVINLSVEKEAQSVVIFDASFSSFWFTLALGLFFILLSRAFSYARTLQQESELIV